MAELGQTREPRQLIPGDAGAIDENVVAIRGRGRAMENAGNGLKKIDGGAWIGAAGDAFREQFSYEPGRWFDAADAFEATATALSSYAGTLRWAQGQAAEAIRLWDQGQAATTRAKQAHARAVADADAQTAADQQTVVPPFSDPGEATRQAARDTLNGARQQLRGASGRAATTIRTQGDKAPEQSGWDAFWGGVGDVAGSVGHTALDVVGLVPIVGEVADGVNALWYLAEGDYTNAALSGAAMVPFAGWVATGGKLGVKAVRGVRSVDDARTWVTGARPRPSMVPSHADRLPFTNPKFPVGERYEWTDAATGKKVRYDAHGRDPEVPATQNAGQGPIYRMRVGKHYLDSHGDPHTKNSVNPDSPAFNPQAANDTHIPYPKGQLPPDQHPKRVAAPNPAGFAGPDDDGK